MIYPNIRRLTANDVVFTWSANLEKEFQDMKKAIQEAVKLSPIDIKKKLYRLSSDRGDSIQHK